jgi:ribonuclease P protein component
LRSKDFRRVYDHGAKFSGPLFTAFCLRSEDGCGPRIGFTIPRAVGTAVVRNRIRRRLREAVRKSLHQVGGAWEIVINPRSRVRSAPFPELEREVAKLFFRCGT